MKVCVSKGHLMGLCLSLYLFPGSPQTFSADLCQEAVRKKLNKTTKKCGCSTSRPEYIEEMSVQETKGGRNTAPNDP